MASHTDRKLTLMSGANDVEIKNKQTNFQNYLHDRCYLDQSAHPLGLALNSVNIIHFKMMVLNSNCIVTFQLQHHSFLLDDFQLVS